MPARQHTDTDWYQCIVIGAGLLGLSTAWSLSRRGVDVLVLEAESPGHEGSGSKGQSRIFRLGYPDPLYVRMALQARDLWRALEAESGRSLLSETGQLTFGPGLPGVAEAMSEVGAPFEPLSSTEAAARFPGLHVDGPALFEMDSGVLMADECLRALHDTGSFDLRSETGVLAIEEEREDITVLLQDGERLTTDVVVNCAGHHALPLMDGVRCPRARPPSLQQVAYFADTTANGRLPIFIEWGTQMIYGLPVIGQDLFKLAQHVRGPSPAAGDEPLEDDPELLGTLIGAACRLLPDLDPTPAATERCTYDNTVDSDFIIDRVGRIVIGCGTSGHGFKFGPLLGEMLADLATGAKPRIDRSRFALTRSFLHALP